MLDRTTEMNTEVEIELTAGGLHEALRRVRHAMCLGSHHAQEPIETGAVLRRCGTEVCAAVDHHALPDALSHHAGLAAGADSECFATGTRKRGETVGAVQSGLVVLTKGSAIAPFIYTLF